MRTTLDLNTGLLREAKQRAAERGTTLTGILESALRQFLHAPALGRGKPFKFRPLVVRGRAKPSVDVADRRALYDRMEGRS
ncbi:MAG: DUF2191 domain-containing protein [bacterium]